MAWSYDVTKQVYDALMGCGLLPECSYIWPGCEPPVDAWKTQCDTPLWVTFTEGIVGDRGVQCEEHVRSVAVTLWIKQCEPEYDGNGTIPPATELMAQAESQAQFRTDILDTLLRWSKQACEGICEHFWDRQKFGAWTCANGVDDHCVLRKLTIEFFKEA